MTDIATYWDNKLQQAVENLPLDRKCFSGFLTNQAKLLKNILQRENFSSSIFALNVESRFLTKTEVTPELAQYIFDVALYIVNNIKIHNFVGIQPISQVGIIHFLGYTVNDEDSVSLEVHSQSVEAGSRKFDLDSNKSVAETGFEILNALETDIVNDLLHVASNLTPVWEGLFTNLPITINMAANEIARKTRRGCGNVVLLSKDTFTRMIDECPKIKGIFDTSNVESSVTSSGITFEGTLNGTIDVYTSQQLPNQSAVVGYKGGHSMRSSKPILIDDNEVFSSEMDTGMFLCPYTLGKTTDGKLALMYGKAAPTNTLPAFANDVYKFRNSGNFYTKLVIE